jgi:hypothetical protein
MTQPAPPTPAADPAVVHVPPLPPTPPAMPAVDLSHPDVVAALAAARQQGQGELSTQLEAERAARADLDRRMAAFETDRAQQIATAEAAAQADAQRVEAERVAALNEQQRLGEQQQALQRQIADMQQQSATQTALLQREREYSELMAYRSEQLGAHGNEIIPQLRELVTGNTPAEIDASISALTERSASILQDVTAAQMGARTQARGASVTAPPVGPSDIDSGYETVTAEQIAAMTMQDFAKNRTRLLGAAARPQQGQGLFG